MNPQKALASLGSQLGAFNLDEARAAVAEAQKVLSSLREQQKEAERSVAAAAREVSKEKAKSGGDAKEDQYSKKSFWDMRYETERSSGLYEWYLSWEEWQQSLLGQLSHHMRGDALLVAGCGNSSTCEDLACAGFENVAGFDYSSVVVDTMTMRSTEKGLSERVRYFTADARNLHDVKDNSIATVLDKGTLDAIASGSSSSGKGEGEDSQTGAVDAMAYILEVWRVLKPGGRFVVLTTMPTDIFFALAIEPLQSSATAYLCDWRNSDKITLTTGEGGKVYSYAVDKLSSPGPWHKNQVKRAAEDKGKGGARADVMEGINALLEEARQAKLEMDAATAKCSARSSEAREALSELNAAEAEQDKLKTRLSQQQEDLVSQLEGEKAERLLRTVTPLAESGKSQGPVSPPIPTPKVVLELLRDQSNLVAGGHVVIRFELQGGDWDDSDAVQLVCVFPRKVSVHPLIEVYKAHDEQTYEDLEYTTEPLAMGGSILVGQVKLSLPSFCSFYVAKYIRTSLCCRQDEKGGMVMERVTSRLCQTEHFIITSGVVFGHPDDAQQTVNASPVDNFSILPSPAQKATRRRGAVPMAFDQSWTLVEDLRSIHTLSIAIGIQKGDPQLARVMAWAHGEDGQLIITVEVDVHNSDGSLVTRYSQVCVSLQPVVLLFEGAQVELDVRFHAGGSHAIVCRIPYEPLADSLRTNLGKSNEYYRPCSSAVACGFCGNEFVAKGKVGQILPLPSGYFDNIMHEFICSDVAPDAALCLSDLTTPVGCMLVGSLHATANPCDVAPGSLSFSCKVVPSFLDLFTGNGGSIVTTPLPTFLKGSRTMPLSSLVNIDTCQLICARCGSYVGDGQLSADCPCPAPHVQKAAMSSSTAQEEFVMADVRDFRFAKQSIELSVQDCASDPLLGEGGITIEQGVARTLSHIYTIFAVSSFVLYVPGQTTVISLRIVSKHYAVALSEQKGLADAIKVSLAISDLESASLSGAEARIALQHFELQTVAKLLEQRSALYGESIFKGHVLSALLL